MKSTRRAAVVAGVFFMVAAVAAVIGLALYGPVLSDPNYIVTGSANDTRVFWGAFFEVILAISVIGTAVTLFPIVKRQTKASRLAMSPVVSLSRWSSSSASSVCFPS